MCCDATTVYSSVSAWLQSCNLLYFRDVRVRTSFTVSKEFPHSHQTPKPSIFLRHCCVMLTPFCTKFASVTWQYDCLPDRSTYQSTRRPRWPVAKNNFPTFTTTCRFFRCLKITLDGFSGTYFFCCFGGFSSGGFSSGGFASGVVICDAEGGSCLGGMAGNVVLLTDERWGGAGG